MLASGAGDGTLRLWDVANGREIRTLAGPQPNARALGAPQAISALAFSPDGKRLASVSTDGTTKLWDLASGKEQRSLAGYPLALSLRFSRDGKELVSTSMIGTIQVWDVATGKPLRTLGGDPRRDRDGYTPFSRPSFLAFPRGQNTLLSLGGDRSVRLWTAGEHQKWEICALYLLEDGGWAVVDPEGRYDASHDGVVAGLHGVIHNQPIALRQLRDRCYEPGLLARCLGFPGAPPRMAPGSKEKP
jgi:hypothetical protein